MDANTSGENIADFLISHCSGLSFGTCEVRVHPVKFHVKPDMCHAPVRESTARADKLSGSVIHSENGEDIRLLPELL